MQMAFGLFWHGIQSDGQILSAACDSHPVITLTTSKWLD